MVPPAFCKKVATFHVTMPPPIQICIWLVNFLVNSSVLYIFVFFAQIYDAMMVAFYYSGIKNRFLARFTYVIAFSRLIVYLFSLMTIKHLYVL